MVKKSKHNIYHILMEKNFFIFKKNKNKCVSYIVYYKGLTLTDFLCNYKSVDIVVLLFSQILNPRSSEQKSGNETCSRPLTTCSCEISFVDETQRNGTNSTLMRKLLTFWTPREQDVSCVMLEEQWLTISFYFC